MISRSVLAAPVWKLRSHFSPKKSEGLERGWGCVVTLREGACGGSQLPPQHSCFCPPPAPLGSPSCWVLTVPGFLCAFWSGCFCPCRRHQHQLLCLLPHLTVSPSDAAATGRASLWHLDREGQRSFCRDSGSRHCQLGSPCTRARSSAVLGRKSSRADGVAARRLSLCTDKGSVTRLLSCVGFRAELRGDGIIVLVTGTASVYSMLGGFCSVLFSSPTPGGPCCTLAL